MNEMLSSRIKNIKGQKFNKLTALNFIELTNYGTAKWKFKCDCGNEKIIASSNVLKGNTVSCGCVKNSRKLPEFSASINKLYYSYKRGAKKRNYNFNLSRENFEKLILDNCHYCGGKPDTQFKHKQSFNGYVIYNGIDRKDNILGYDINNCVSCCTSCNYAKHNKSYNEFQNWLINLVNYRNGLK